MSRDTLFPALDGSSPGDVEVSDNLGDTPRPTELEWSLPESAAGIVSGSAPDQSGAAADFSEEPAPSIPVLEGQDAPLSPPSAPEPRARKRSAEDRINQLTARWRQEQNENVELRQQVGYLTQMVERVLHAPSSRAPSPGEVSPDLLAGGTEAPAPSRNTNDIESSIQRALQPLVQRVESQEAMARRQSLHGESFARAAEEFPELAQRGSEARRLFDRLYQSHPLASLEDAPEQIALMVRGAMESARRDSAGQPQRKLSAAVHVPSPSPTDSTPLGESQAAKGAYEQGIQNLRRGGRVASSLDTYKAVRMAGRNRRR